MVIQLNTSQQQAVEHVAGRLLITAGAGSGKTRTLAERFAHAVAAGREEHGDRPVERILTITFTDKAAGELAERVRGALRGQGLPGEARAVDSAWISTIHGFCTRLLRREAIAAGIDPGFAMLEESRSAELEVEVFEQAVETCLGADEAVVQRLFDTYGFVPVRSSVLQLSRYLRVRGIGPGEIELAEDEDVLDVCDEARTLFSALAVTFSAHADNLRSAASHQCACESVLACLGDLDPVDDDPAGLAGEIWLALADYGATMHSAQATAEAIELLKTRRAQLIGRCARIMTTPLERGLLDLTAAFLELHREAKSRIGALDFDDLIGMARELLIERPEALTFYRDRFALTMVDEFQDTDALQLALIMMIGGENLATVGDTRQSIYSFRGADVAVYRNHREEMVARGALSVELDRNYRSHPDIIAFVNRAFGSDIMFGPDDEGLVAARDELAAPRVRAGVPRIDIAVVDRVGVCGAKQALAEEAGVLAERLAALRDEGFSPSEMVILVRRYRDAPVFADALEAAGLSTMIVGGNRFFGLPEVAALRALCRVMSDPYDDETLIAVLMSDLSGLDDDDLYALGWESDGNRRRSSLWEAFVRTHGGQDVRGGAGGRLLTCIENARMRAAAEGLAVAVFRAAHESGLARVLMGRGAEGRLAWANVTKFVRKAAAFECAGGAGPLEFVDALDAEEDAGQRESPDVAAGCTAGAVAVMSVHAAKGLEFPVVAVPTLGSRLTRGESGFWRAESAGGRSRLALQLPRAMAPRSDVSVVKTPLFDEMDRRAIADAHAEAKRLLYVACTRAEEVLILTGSAKNATMFDGDTPLGWLMHANENAMRTVLASGKAGAVDVGGAKVAFSIHECSPEPEDRAEGGVEQHDTGDEQLEPAVEPWEPERPQPTSPDRVSYSDIALYERCTLRYWAERIAGMRCIAERARTGATARGTALHAALALSDAAGRPPSAERIRVIAAGCGIVEHERASIVDAIELFAESRCAREIAAWAQVRREVPFAVRLVDDAQTSDGPLLVGALDLYSRDAEAALIVDYKSGESGDESELSDRYRLQAECYAIVALRDGAERVEVRFVRPEVIGNDGQPQEVRYAFTQCDTGSIERGLLAMWHRMESEPYLDLGRWNYDVCPGCPASGAVCPLTQPRRGAE